MKNKHTIPFWVAVGLLFLTACEPYGEALNPPIPGCRSVTLTISGPITENGLFNVGTRENSTITYYFSHGRCDSIVIVDRKLIDGLRLPSGLPSVTQEWQRWIFGYTGNKFGPFSYDMLLNENGNFTASRSFLISSPQTNAEGELINLANDYSYLFSPEVTLRAKSQTFSSFPLFIFSSTVLKYDLNRSILKLNLLRFNTPTSPTETQYEYGPFRDDIYLDEVISNHTVGLIHLPFLQGTGLKTGNNYIAVNVLDNPLSYSLDFVPAQGKLPREVKLSRHEEQGFLTQDLEYSGGRVTGIAQRWQPNQRFASNSPVRVTPVRITAVERSCN